MDKLIKELLSNKQFIVNLKKAEKIVKKTGHEAGFSVKRNCSNLCVGKVTKGDSCSWTEEFLSITNIEGTVHFHPNESEVIIPSKEDLKNFIPLVSVSKKSLKIILPSEKWMIIAQSKKNIHLLFLLPFGPISLTELIYWEQIIKEEICLFSPIQARNQIINILLEFNINGKYKKIMG